MSTSPFGTPSAPGPFEAAALAVTPMRSDSAPAPTATAVFGVPPQYVPDSAPSGHTAVEPLRAPTEPAQPVAASALAPRARSASSRPSPIILAAIAGGTVLAGALGAWVLLSTGDDFTADGTSAVVTTVSTPAPSSSGLPTSAASAGPAAGPGSTLGGRDPFVPLVAQPAGPAGTEAPLPVPTSTGSVVDTGTTDGGSAGGAVDPDPAPVPQTTVTVTAPPSPSPSQTPLTTAQTCGAASGPLDAVERLLASGSAPVDTGTALRGPVTALRAAVDASGDAALASRLDVATSSAESLRTQLLGGVAATDDQLATQVSLDAAVRSACS